MDSLLAPRPPPQHLYPLLTPHKPPLCWLQPLSLDSLIKQEAAAAPVLEALQGL